MPLETGTYISDLNASNPVGATDQKAQGDDHIRLIKSTIKTTFPNITGSVTPSHTLLNLLSSTTNDRVLRVTGGVANVGQLTAGMFPNTVVPDAALSSNVPLKSGTNVFTGAAAAATDSAPIFLSSTTPGMAYQETDAAANNQVWYTYADAGFWNLSAFDDAGTSQGIAIRVQRSAHNIASIALAATSITLNGVAASDYALLSVANSFSLTQHGGAGFSTSGALADIGQVGQFAFQDLSSGVGRHGSYNWDTALWAPVLLGGSTVTVQVNTLGNVNAVVFAADGTITTPDTSASEVGLRGVPRVTSGQQGGQCLATSSGFTLSTGLAAGKSYAFYNDSAAAITITQGVGLTLRLAGTTTTGNRTLAPRGLATLWVNSTTEYIISGAGLS